MFKLFISLLGLVAGYALARIAPEELESGMKYFQLIKKIVFIILSGVVSYYLYPNKLLALFLVLSIILFYLISKKLFVEMYHKIILEFLIYLFFITPYVLINNQQFKLMIASLLFIYGFPLASIIYHENKKRS